MTSYRSHEDGSHYPVQGRSLFNHEARSELYSRRIRWDTPMDARSSTRFADEEWTKLRGRREQRVHLLQAMNQAANRAKVSEGENSESHRVLRHWVNEHKGKE